MTGRAKSSPSDEADAMLAFAVLSLNFIALAGIVLGALLRSPRVRNALELAYIHTSDLAADQSLHNSTHELVWAFTRTALLNSRHTLSLRKILVISLMSTVVFSNAVASDIGSFPPNSQIITLFGGGVLGNFAGTLIFYLIAWPGHFIYDYLICLALLRISKTGDRRSYSKQTAYMLLAFVALTLIPTCALAAVFFIRVYVHPILSIHHVSHWESILILPLLWNGPTFLWLGIASFVLKIKFIYFMTAPNLPFFLLSSIISSSICFFDLFARGLTKSKSAMSIAANITLRLTETKSDELFNTSMIIFTIGNGLCQIYGISIKP